MRDLRVRFAEEPDVDPLHRFLILVSAQVLLAPIDLMASRAEIARIVNHEACLLAEIDGEIVGSLGLVQTSWWYNPEVYFFTDRWFFIIPFLKGKGIAARLLAEASAFATETGCDICLNGHFRRRAKGVGRGVCFSNPLMIWPGMSKEDLARLGDS